MKKYFVIKLMGLLLPCCGLFAAAQPRMSADKKALVERWLDSVGEFKKGVRTSTSSVRFGNGYKRVVPRDLPPITAPRAARLVGERERSETIFDVQSSGSSMNHSIRSRPYRYVVPKSMQEKVTIPLTYESWVMPPHLFDSPRDQQEPTTLHQAVWQERYDVIARLLHEGADARERDQADHTPIDIAAHNRDERALELLLGIADRPEGERIQATAALMIQAHLPVRHMRQAQRKSMLV